jgi:ferritin-like metal-binding protein YciE
MPRHRVSRQIGLGSEWVPNRKEEEADVSRMTSPRELFVHELQDVYYAEKTLTRVLPTLASEASDAELTRAFESHAKETQKQVSNLEKVFKNLGERAEGQPCPGIDGIKEEHDEFMREHQTTPVLSDVFLTGSAARAEHYEIAAYNSLIAKARALGERDSVKLLQANLKQEKDALKKVETISKRIVKSTNGSSTRSRSSGSSRSRSASARSTARRTTAKRSSSSRSRS